MLLRDAISELVKLVDKVADVDAAHGICLRERHGLRETLPASQLGKTLTRTWPVILLRQ
jgi:hypothetical protein